MDAIESNRRRRTVALAAVAALVVGAGAFALPLLLGDDEGGGDASRPEAPASVSPRRPLAYIDGSTIHYGDRSVDVGGEPDPTEMVQTDHGVVFNGGWHNHQDTLKFTDGRTVVVLGAADDNAPVVDDRGPLVAWVDPNGQRSGDEEVVVVDTSRLGSGDAEVVRFPNKGRSGDQDFLAPVAIDDGFLYFFGARGIVRRDLETGDDTVLAESGDHYYRLKDAANGILAWTDSDEITETLYVGSSIESGRRIVDVSGGQIDAVMSPDGAFVSTMLGDKDDRFSGKVYDARSGADITPDASEFFPDASWLWGFSVWLDERSVIASGVLISDAADLPVLAAECDIVTGECTKLYDSTFHVEWD